MNREEVWIDLKGFEGLYLISNKGRIKSVITGKLKKKICNDTNCAVSLSKNGRHYKKAVSRMVAKHFVPNPKRLPIARHIGSPLDDSAANLEWTTRRLCSKGGGGSIAVMQLDMNGRVVGTYNSIREASSQLNLAYGPLSRAVKGLQNSSGGYQWVKADPTLILYDEGKTRYKCKQCGTVKDEEHFSINRVPNIRPTLVCNECKKLNEMFESTAEHYFHFRDEKTANKLRLLIQCYEHMKYRYYRYLSICKRPFISFGLVVIEEALK